MAKRGCGSWGGLSPQGVWHLRGVAYTIIIKIITTLSLFKTETPDYFLEEFPPNCKDVTLGGV